MQVIDQKLRSLHHYPFLVTAQRVVVGTPLPFEYEDSG
jgi:hypothetical protein